MDNRREASERRQKGWGYLFVRIVRECGEEGRKRGVLGAEEGEHEEVRQTEP
jgi:hypothetical protein